MPFQSNFWTRLTNFLLPPWLALFIAAYVFGSFMVENKHGGHYVWSDAEGYYMYLPALIVHGTFENFPVKTKTEFKKYPGTNKVFTKYTYGVALMESPFFLVAYLARKAQGFDVTKHDGTDYAIGLLLTGCFYGVLGLFFVFSALKYHFKNKWVWWLTIAVLLLGTNLLHYMTRAPGMSHVYSFCLISFLVYFTPKLIGQPTYRHFAIAGFISGLIILIRPTNGVMLLFPMLYGVDSWKSMVRRFSFFWEHLQKMLFSLLFFVLVWIPQFCYWYYISGKWLLYSYGKESFTNWNDPQITNVLFSHLNGYLVYNPVMILPIVTTFFLLRKNTLNSWATLGIFAISTYLFASWWCWWYGGAYGHRCFVDLLPVLSLPLAFVLDKIMSAQKIWVKILCFSAIATMVYYNLRCTLLYGWEWSHTDWTLEKYWEEVFFKVF